MKPQPIDDAMMAFPANVRELLPPWDSIPREFKGWPGNEWVQLASSWFFKGLDGSFVWKEGIDDRMAMRHLSACLGSFQPKHEHKTAGVAYLLSLWAERFEPAAPTRTEEPRG